MQKRLVRKLDLERTLLQVEPHPKPKANLEQYTIPADLAAEILYIATYRYDDIVEKTVVDLGCGTGRLALGAAFLGAKDVIGVDIDKVSVSVARRNAEKLDLKDRTNWIAGDLRVIVGSFDTILQNPPFGVQKRGADRNFIWRAIELGHSIYSLHKSGKRNKEFMKKLRGPRTKFTQTPSPFIRDLVEKSGGKITAIFPMQMEIPKMFEFHKKRKHTFRVDLFVIEGKARLNLTSEESAKRNVE